MRNDDSFDALEWKTQAAMTNDSVLDILDADIENNASDCDSEADTSAFLHCEGAVSSR